MVMGKLSMAYNILPKAFNSICKSTLNCQYMSTTSTPDVTDTTNGTAHKHTFSVAPMMEYTDRYQRKLTRLMSSKSVLYTEMITTNALVRSPDTLRFLQADFSIEDPVILQLGGSDPARMKAAAKVAFDYGYKEMNINCGCPSEKVADAGCFGAALMLKPALVSELALAVGEVTGIPATIKCRIGVDNNDSYGELVQFIKHVSEVAHVNHFIIHARKALLGKKFTPADNRKIPPLKYDTVYSLVKDFPHLTFTINGGVHSMEECVEHLSKGVHGVMVGRAVIEAPYQWRNIDSKLYHSPDPCLSRRQIVQQYADYAAIEEVSQGPRARASLMKPILNLFHKEYNGRLFRKLINDRMVDKAVAMPLYDILMEASSVLPDSVMDSVE
jgi:tRNA-dihydrouridine synthase A